MKRRVFNVLVAMSVALCLAVSALWVRSLQHFELVDVKYARWPQPDELHSDYMCLSWYSNTLRFDVIRVSYTSAHFRGQADEFLKGFRRTYPPGLRWAFAGEKITSIMNWYDPGFAAARSPYTISPAGRGDRWIVSVRPWLPALLSAALPAVWLIRFIRARRDRGLGLCRSCGYDLRATPERCPECGTATQRKPAGATQPAT